jgi:hypothetical protein
MDTVTIRIAYPDFEITHAEYFSPRVRFNRNEQIDKEARPRDVYKRFVQSQSAQDKANSVYKPVLTITQRMKPDSRELQWFLNIQMSVPRILYPNNMYEILAQDSSRIIFKLTSILSAMGIETTPEIIADGTVTKFQVGKNILLPND